MVSTKLLAQYGFLNDEGKKLMGQLSVKERGEFIKYLGDVDKYVAQEVKVVNEEGADSTTGYPETLNSHRLIYESESANVEESYFWILSQMTVGFGHFKPDDVEKITDIFSASSLSTTFGASSQRLSIQQDKAAQFLKIISDMTKSLFQITGDINKVKEKEGYYKSSFSKDMEESEDGDFILKGQFIDLVEGGAKSTTSVFGMAREVGFTTLPDLFFKICFNDDNLDDILKKLPKRIKDLEFGNESMKRVLEMKLSQYYRWKFKGYDQLKLYKKMYIGYLKQHYNNIKLYMNWVKPYLRNIQRLSIDQHKSDSPSLISAFEGNLIEVEILGKKKKGSHYAVVIINFDYNAMPKSSWDARYQQNKVSMVGRMEMNLKAYAWTETQINNYKAMKDAENLELIKEIDEGMREGMEAIEKTVLEYLNQNKSEEEEDNRSLDEKYKIEKGKLVKIKKNKGQKGSELTAGSILEPFVELFKSVNVFSEPFKSINFSSSKSDKTEDSSGAEGEARLRAYLLYKNYKKGHRLLSW